MQRLPGVVVDVLVGQRAGVNRRLDRVRHRARRVPHLGHVWGLHGRQGFGVSRDGDPEPERRVRHGARGEIDGGGTFGALDAQDPRRVVFELGAEPCELALDLRRELRGWQGFGHADDGDPPRQREPLADRQPRGPTMPEPPEELVALAGGGRGRLGPEDPIPSGPEESVRRVRLGCRCRRGEPRRWTPLKVSVEPGAALGPERSRRSVTVNRGGRGGRGDGRGGGGQGGGVGGRGHRG